jgi:ATP-dependent Clp protease adaptor protein ClpS
MTNYSQNLEHSLQRATRLAEEQNRKYATSEDLLLALIDDPDAASVMRALLVDFERLRRDLIAYMEGAVDDVDDEVDDEVDEAIGNRSGFDKLTPDLRRIIHRALVRAQSSGRDVTTGTDILIELFGEAAGHFLKQQGVTCYDAKRHVSRGVVADDRTSLGGGDAEATDSRSTAGLLANVRLLDDDYTPMEFVVYVLERVFEMDREAATRLMLEIHNKGGCVCGVYPYDAAQAKATEVLALARKHQHPLQCILERMTTG